MKFSWLEKITCLLTALTLAFLLGWFFSRQAGLRQAFTPPAASGAPSEVTAAVSPSPSPTEPVKININTATAEALNTLPGIGKKRAADIVAYREAHGPFPVAESLTDVPGIGETILAQCIDYITVED